ncbi:MAG: tungstate ABC transporter substrate-binding protein WtpA [Anaerolineaceae bacterium]|nr:tungstate ABC transporter substrate-binding protein WtpA [Anaerolineaceae bacterium]
MKPHKLFLILLSLVLFMAGCAPKPKTKLLVFAAGSLIQPFTELSKAFEAKNPDIEVQLEFHGSIQVIRHVVDIHEEIDLVATADQSLIPMLMYPPDAAAPEGYASWYLAMATNKLAIAYTEKSKYAGEINQENWWKILSQPDVKVGLSDPRFDAVGYRQLMIFALAQNQYKKPDLFFNFVDGQFKQPITLTESDSSQQIHIPEILETRPDSHLVLRGGSIALNALLEAGEIDYAFEYESVIKQHNFKMLPLPDSLNLGSPEMDPAYGKVSVVLDFQRFAKVKPEFKGETIRYGLTIPNNAPHMQQASRFVRFLYSHEGQAIMAEQHHPLLTPPRGDHLEKLPKILQESLPKE